MVTGWHCSKVAFWDCGKMVKRQWSNVAMWYYDNVALWQCGNLAMWYCCIVAMWQCGTLTMWQCGIVAKWQSGNVALLHCGNVATWQCGIMAMWKCGIVALWHCGNVAMLHCGNVAMCNGAIGPRKGDESLDLIAHLRLCNGCGTPWLAAWCPLLGHQVPRRVCMAALRAPAQSTSWETSGGGAHPYAAPPVGTHRPRAPMGGSVCNGHGTCIDTDT